MARLTPGVSHPNLAKNHMVANPKGYPRRGPGGHTLGKPTLYAWPDLYRAFPTLSKNHMVAIPKGYPKVNPRGRT